MEKMHGMDFSDTKWQILHPEDKIIGVDLVLFLDLEILQKNKDKSISLKQKLLASFKRNNIFLGNLEIYFNYGK